MLVLLLTSVGIRAQNTLIVRGNVNSPAGASVVNLPVELHYDSLPGGLYIPPSIAYTDVNGSYSDTISRPGTMAFLRVKMTDCNGQLLSNVHVVTAHVQQITSNFGHYCTQISFNCDASFTPSPIPGNNLSYTFTFNQPFIPSNAVHTWNFGDGTHATSFGNSSPNKQYSAPGTYVVSVSLTNSSTNCSTSYNDTLIISNNPSNCQAGYQTTPIPSPSLPFSGYRFHFTSSGPSSSVVTLDFGDGTSYSGPLLANSFVDHQYANPGVYQACLTVSDTLSGCLDQFCNSIAIPGIPVSTCTASFQASYNQGTAPVVVTFNNTSSGTNPPNTSYLWNFGDGASSSLENPSHSYGANGIYLVTLNIYDSLQQCSSSYSDSVSIGPVNLTCAVNFTYNVWPTTVGTAVSFTPTINSTNPQLYTWYFGNGSLIHQRNPVRVFNNGLHTVCLTTTDLITGCIAIYCDTIQIGNGGGSSGCNAQFQAHVPTGNAPVFVNFINNSTGGGATTQYFWDFGDGQSSFGQNVNHVYTNNGTFIVQLFMTDSLNQCQSQFTDTVIIGTTSGNCSALFQPSVSPNNPLGFAFINQSITNSQAPITYVWNFGDGSPQIVGVNPGYTYQVPGTYLVCLTMIVGNCSDVFCMNLTVGQPQTNFSLNGMISGPASGIGNQVNVYLFEITNGGTWIPVDTTTAIDSAGIMVYSFSQLPSSTYAVLAELTPNSPQWQLYFPTYVGNTISWTNAQLIYLNAGTSLMPWNINMVNFLIMPAGGGGNISGNVLRGNLRTTTGNMTNVTVQLLDGNLSPIRTSRTNVQGTFNFSDLPMGSYFVHIDYPGRPCTPVPVILNMNQNSQSGINFTMNRGGITTSTQELFMGVLEQVYPNPVQDVLFVGLNLNQPGKYLFSMYNLSGQEVMSESLPLTNGSQRVELNTASLKPGLYFMKITDENGGFTQYKVSKQ